MKDFLRRLCLNVRVHLTKAAQGEIRLFGTFGAFTLERVGPVVALGSVLAWRAGALVDVCLASIAAEACKTHVGHTLSQRSQPFYCNNCLGSTQCLCSSKGLIPFNSLLLLLLLLML